MATTTFDGDGYEHRPDEEEQIMCAYCDRLVHDCPVPPTGDDQAWEEIAAHHQDACEWVLTRAHRLEVS